ncbi:MAG TPA: cytotoxic translational repressor of toxin-antitoxin stability system, partial [bacterium]|nr:cytotoxic translational repressor of toxin-antitoxin stability system [bacterium]
PTYVAVWEVRNKNVRLVEVIYVGTHEAAPY